MKSISLTCLLLFFQAWSSPCQTSWQKVVDVNPTQRIYIAGFGDAAHGITGGYFGATYDTVDGGKTWTKAKNYSLCRWGLDIVSDTIAFTCGSGGDNRKTADGGQTWTEMADFGPDQPPDQCRFISFVDAKTGWVAAPAVMARTSDAGATWTQVKLPDGMDKVAALDLLGDTQLTALVLGADGKIYKSVDNGATWSSRPVSVADHQITFDPGSAPVNALRFQNAREGTAIAYETSPRQAWVALQTTNGGDSWVVESVTGEMDPQSAVYLSGDGRYVTLYSSHRVVVFERRAGG